MKKIRARALTTTMFARLFLADLFIHGIGGGIYDELTDRIMARYFAMSAPAFLILSATLLLPLPRFPDAAERCRQRARELRDMTYKPELFLAPSEPNLEMGQLVREKQEWIRRDGSTHEARLERFERIRAISERLRDTVQARIERVQNELAGCRREIEWDAVASRRDYAFCLYPEEMLRAFFSTEVI